MTFHLLLTSNHLEASIMESKPCHQLSAIIYSLLVIHFLLFHDLFCYVGKKEDILKNIAIQITLEHRINNDML